MVDWIINIIFFYDAHREFAELLYSLKGFVILSGYPSAIYEVLFESKGWQRVERAAQVMGGATKTEALWLSPATQKALAPVTESSNNLFSD